MMINSNWINAYIPGETVRYGILVWVGSMGR